MEKTSRAILGTPHVDRRRRLVPEPVAMLVAAGLKGTGMTSMWIRGLKLLGNFLVLRVSRCYLPGHWVCASGQSDNVCPKEKRASCTILTHGF